MKLTILLSLAISSVVLSPALANQRVQGNCEIGNRPVITGGVNSVSKFMQSFPACTVTVYITGSGGTLATLYSTNTGTPLTNPFTSDTAGHYAFYSANGLVDIQLSGGGLASPVTYGAIQLFDPVVLIADVTSNQFAGGAKCNGVNDDAAAIQAAENYIHTSTAASGKVVFPSGTCIIGSTITKYGLSHWQGAGIESTILYLKNSANVDLIKTYQYDSLHGTDSALGPYDWSIRDMTLDGNKANNVSGTGIKSYSYGFILAQLRIRGFAAEGIHSEWSSAGAPNGGGVQPDYMEATLEDVKVHDCGVGGVYWAGPHDSTIANLRVWNNVGKALWIAANGASRLREIAVYGTHTYGFYIEAQINGFNLLSENASVYQFALLSGNSILRGAYAFDFTAGGAGSLKGYQIGNGSQTMNNLSLDASCYDLRGGCIDFTNLNGTGGSMYVFGTQASGIAVLGGAGLPLQNFYHIEIGGSPGYYRIQDNSDTISNVNSVGVGNHSGLPAAGGGFTLWSGANVKWDGSNWVTAGDGASNGGTLATTEYAGGSNQRNWYIIPSTGGTAQTISNASLPAYVRFGVSGGDYYTKFYGTLGTGSESGLLLKKWGTTSAANVQWQISHRTNDKDLHIYSYDGSTFSTWAQFLYSTTTVAFNNGNIVVGDTNAGGFKFRVNGTVNLTGATTLGATHFASLGTPSNGTLTYCDDCTIANPCAGVGSGAVAKRLNGVWVCN